MEPLKSFSRLGKKSHTSLLAGGGEVQKGEKEGIISPLKRKHLFKGKRGGGGVFKKGKTGSFFSKIRQTPPKKGAATPS